eukprot:Gb_32325 [translate_table: standard]
MELGLLQFLPEKGGALQDRFAKSVSGESLVGVLDPLISGLPPLGDGTLSPTREDIFWLSEVVGSKDESWSFLEERWQRKEVDKVSTRGVVIVNEESNGKRCVKQKRNQVNLVLGDDIEMHQVVGLLSQALIGRFHGHSTGVQSLKIWFKEKWEPLCGYSPVFYLLARGLLLDFWSLEVFKEIGNSLGSYIEADMSFVDTNAMSMARILVSLDLREGLGDNILISKGGLGHNQLLDYVEAKVKDIPSVSLCNSLDLEEKIHVAFSFKEDEEGVSISPKSKESGSQIMDLPFPKCLAVSSKKSCGPGGSSGVKIFNGPLGNSLVPSCKSPDRVGEYHPICSQGNQLPSDFPTTQILSGDDGGSISKGTSRYLLRPRSKGARASVFEVEGGLGIGACKGVPGPGSGRKSHLAQAKAKREITTGKQKSISGELGEELFILNLYGPYANKVAYWDKLFAKALFGQKNLIVGGDLNFVLGRAKIWGLSIHPNPLSNYFLKKLEVVDLLDVEPMKLSPTWRNLRVGEASIAKRLDKILIVKSLVNDKFRLRQWVGVGGFKDLSILGMEHFDGLYKEENKASIAKEGLHSIKTKKLKVMVVKLDLSKAYDRTSRVEVSERDAYYCKRSRRDATKLREILDLYSSAIGMKIHLTKSNISFAEINKDKSWWLSKGGRLILVKSILEAIPVYWLSLTLIPKGVLDKIRKLSFRFLWPGNREKEGIPLVKWQVVAAPKASGGWGIKNLHLFGKALAAKFVWRLISSEGLWCQVLSHKYIAPDTVEYWIRTPSQNINGTSIVWKVVVLAFPLVGRWLVWRVGIGRRVCLGLDPWAVDTDLSSVWSQEWKSVVALGLRGGDEEKWELYISSLKRSHVRIKDSSDALLWSKNLASGHYSPKGGYKALCEVDNLEEPQWWWLDIWKFKCPLKTKIFMQLAIRNKVWKEVANILGLREVWAGDSIEGSLRLWCLNPTLKSVKALPLIVAWGVWLAQNASIFDEQEILPIQCALQSKTILDSFKQIHKEKSVRRVTEEQIDKKGAWAYFDGACQGSPPSCGVGRVLYLNDSHLFKFKASLGGDSNNFVELMALKLLMHLAAEKGTRFI